MEEIPRGIDEELWNKRLKVIRDPYKVAIDLLKQGNIKELISETARVIECTPTAILNTGISLEPLVERAIDDGVQNHLCYILRETRLLAKKYGVEWKGDKAIERLRKNLLLETQILGRFPPNKPKTSMQRASNLRGGEYLFEEQYKVYGHDRPIA